MYGSKFLGVLLGLVSIPVASAMAQAGAHGQCGGMYIYVVKTFGSSIDCNL